MVSPRYGGERFFVQLAISNERAQAELACKGGA